MSTTDLDATIVPSHTELYGNIRVITVTDTGLCELRQSIRETETTEYEEYESLVFRIAAIPDLIAALNDLHMDWKRANSPLYRDPSTVTKGDA